MRKRLKRLRYLTEFLAPAVDGDDLNGFLDSLHPALDALGRLHDECVASALYADIASKDPRAWFGVGWLAARRDRSTAACRKALTRIREVPRLRKPREASKGRRAPEGRKARKH